ncbi:MAG: hypothetical protein WCF17_05765, partial [Terracidiphilus sp.]
LSSALRTWVEDALDYLNKNAQASFRSYSDERWQRGEDGAYRRGEVIETALSHEAIEKLKQLPSYTALEAVASASPVIGPMIGQLVGSGMGLSQFDLWQLAGAALPPASEIISGTISTSFDERYSEIMRQTAEAEATYETVCLVQGVSFEADPLQLAPGLAIAKLTPAEVENSLASGLLASTFGSVPIYQLQEGASFALKRLAKIPRIVGATISDDQRDTAAKIQDMSEDSEQLLQCLSLLTSERISITGQLTVRTDSDFTAFGSARWFRSYPAPRPFIGPGYRLDASKCEELRNLWTLAHDESFPQNKALALALRRLGFATQRDRPEDRLLDVFIASEAFYLTDNAGDAKDRGELKYRLALRAAVWSDGTLDDWSKRQVFQHMRRGYDIRSTIAHGGEPKPRDLKIKDQSVELNAFVQTTEGIVRAALYKALRQIQGTSTRLIIPWDDLILPDS